MLDLGTVILLHKTSLLAGAATLLLVWLRAERPEGLATIAAAFLMLAVGAFLAGLGEMGRIPAYVWRDTSPGLGAAAYTLLLLGVCRLDRRVGPRRWLLLVPAALLAVGLATPVFADNAIRATVFHVTAALALVAAGRDVLVARRRAPLPSRVPLAAVLILCGTIYGGQGVLLILGVATPNTLAWGFVATLMLNFTIAALVISIVRERREAWHRRVAVTDALTGIPNRHGFLTLVPERLGAGAAIAMIDLDHFKTVNDRFGHAAGDVVLAAFAHAASRCLRKGEILSRIGGEEFVLYLPDAADDRALERVEAMRRAARAEPVRWRGETIAVTASVGVALAERAGTLDRERLVAEADAAAYEAKSRGRDRVVVSGGTVPPPGSRTAAAQPTSPNAAEATVVPFPVPVRA